MALTLVEKVLGLHDALEQAGLPHAFGGALALGYCIEEPRATQDIDVNVFVGTERVDDLLASIAPNVVAGAAQESQLRRDAQARLRWDETPVDVFLSTHDFHEQAATRRRFVPFVGLDDLPVLACRDLAVFKAFFARPKDGIDLASMAAAGAIDEGALVAELDRLLGPDSTNAAFVRAALHPQEWDVSPFPDG